jgi:hypothetical protein
MLKRSVGAVLGFLMVASGVAFAQNAHFIGTPKASFVEDFDLAVAFKEAGLGNTPVTYTATATAGGSCACVTHSGNCPAAANKFPPIGVTGTVTIPPARNGQITGTVIVEEPDCTQVAPSQCPNGQTNTLVSISYSDITLTDETDGVSSGTSPTSLSATPATCP